MFVYTTHGCRIVRVCVTYVSECSGFEMGDRRHFLKSSGSMDEGIAIASPSGRGSELTSSSVATEVLPQFHSRFFSRATGENTNTSNHPFRISVAEYITREITRPYDDHRVRLLPTIVEQVVLN
jgi:hypothetical protein